MNEPGFHEFKKQASFFFKEKIKSARLALTDVTPAQLLVEEATDGNPGGADGRTLKIICKAAFEVDDYCRIVGILHKRLVKFEKRNWRASYQALIVLENLLTHGPESVAQEFQCDTDIIREMERFQHIDEKGFNWGLNVRKKSERILMLIEKKPLLKEERDKARKISRGIEGFSSFCLRTSSGQESSRRAFDRCNSQFNDSTNHEDFFIDPNENGIIKTKTEKALLHTNPKMEESSSENFTSARIDSQRVLVNGESWNFTVDSNPLLKDVSRTNMPVEDDHPFDNADHLTAMSLLSTADEVQHVQNE
ncbi:hypothetical protein BUALT_Bualt13G0087300 [Buddleja alternifolia]|uniref:ENTH domain-containing protein n=1 Tax=Buddleja alternifolia TaxID=168488 RepID=A0AAV6WRC5_9LAMI|nr:hypothetical protein BUALT_Bualt13G0087300 [Buddleja alternifolia]